MTSLSGIVWRKGYGSIVLPYRITVQYKENPDDCAPEGDLVRYGTVPGYGTFISVLVQKRYKMNEK